MNVRIRLGDLLAYQQRARCARAAGLDEMVRVSEEAGIYDLSDDVSVERVDDWTLARPVSRL